jgi:nitrogen fixation/metabolism regulation signal transduction histidine kinase
MFLFIPEIIRLQDESLSFHDRAVAADKVLILHAKVWPAILLIVCLVALHSFRFFHRVFGPLYRFRWAFEQVRNGNLNFLVKIRKNDFLHQEEATLNEMLELVAGKWKDVQKTSADALKSLNVLERSGTDESNLKDAYKELLHVHRRHLEKLADTAQYFKVEKEEQQQKEEAPDD